MIAKIGRHWDPGAVSVEIVNLIDVDLAQVDRGGYRGLPARNRGHRVWRRSEW